MKENITYIDDIFLNKISKLTGFEIDKIELLLSRRKNEDSPSVDYHEFKYEDKVYIFTDNKLMEKN